MESYLHIIFILTGALAALFLVMLARTVRAMPGPRSAPPGPDPTEPLDADGMAARLSGALRIRTVALADAQTDVPAFMEFHRYLEQNYPLIHRHLERETVAECSLIYRWRGSDPGKSPIALLAHMDVVPVTRDTQGDWQHPPFGGDDDGRFVWGRGALDMKGHLISVMEAVERLLEAGYRPVRDVYLCLGHNEEIVGAPDSGALAIVKTLEAQGIRLECLIDEGGMVTSGDALGIRTKTAMVGVSEKGYIDLEMAVTLPGGHASQPPASTGLGRLSRAVCRMEKAPFRLSVCPATSAMLDALASRSGFWRRFVLCNLWITRPFVLRSLTGDRMTNAMVRTTAAATMAQASPAANVLPQLTRFTVNCRVLPGETIRGTLERLRRVCRDDGIRFTILRGKEPSETAPMDTGPWRLLKRTIERRFAGAAVIPYLMTGGTDACMYAPVCGSIYRFSPMLLDPGEIGGIHGTNERVSRENLLGAARFFMDFLKGMDLV